VEDERERERERNMRGDVAEVLSEMLLACKHKVTTWRFTICHVFIVRLFVKLTRDEEWRERERE